MPPARGLLTRSGGILPRCSQFRNALAEVKREYRLFRAAFPDLQVTIEDVVAEADLVVIRSRLHATHRGAFQGLAPTGNRIEVEAISIFRIAEGKIAERWGLNTDFMRQLTAE